MPDAAGVSIARRCRIQLEQPMHERGLSHIDNNRPRHRDRVATSNGNHATGLDSTVIVLDTTQEVAELQRQQAKKVILRRIAQIARHKYNEPLRIAREIERETTIVFQRIPKGIRQGMPYVVFGELQKNGVTEYDASTVLNAVSKGHVAAYRLGSRCTLFLPAGVRSLQAYEHRQQDPGTRRPGRPPAPRSSV